jgi:hypothetical protein
MRRLAGVELLKLTTIGTLQRFIALTVVLAIFATAGAIASADFDKPEPVRSGASFRVSGVPAPAASARNRADARDVALAWTLVPLIALTLGVVAAGVERQHRTLTASALAVPRRRRLLLAKVLAVLPVAAGLTLLALALNQAIAIPWLDGQGVSTELSGGTWALLIAGGLLASLAAAVLGVAIGIVFPFPATGIVVGIGFLLVIEPVIANHAEDVAQFLPGAAMDALLRGLTSTSNQVVLPQGIGALVLVAWAAVLFAAAARWLDSRDLA